MTDKQCERCGEVNPAEIHTCSPQEPVAWRYNGNLHEFDPSDWAEGEVIPLYTAPPQRQQRTYTLRKWVGLTDEEIGNVIEASQITLKNYCSEDKQTEYARAIEAKLKEKNT